ncbi:hypothetical protein BS78_04G025500 [Paspalum vaginatum]|nr:hypothetical protein BS78_04G025500 [Paspalum vaginatum]
MVESRHGGAHLNEATVPSSKAASLLRISLPCRQRGTPSHNHRPTPRPPQQGPLSPLVSPRRHRSKNKTTADLIPENKTTGSCLSCSANTHLRCHNVLLLPRQFIVSLFCKRFYVAHELLLFLDGCDEHAQFLPLQRLVLESYKLPMYSWLYDYLVFSYQVNLSCARVM